MPSSESEEFESADEDLDVAEVQKSSAPKNSAKQDVRHPVKESLTPKQEPSIKLAPAEPSSTLPEKKSTKNNVAAESQPATSQPPDCGKPEPEPRQSKNVELVDKETKPNILKLGPKKISTSKAVSNPEPPRQPTPELTPKVATAEVPNETDNWDFDDWEKSSSAESDDSSEKSATATATSASAAPKQSTEPSLTSVFDKLSQNKSGDSSWGWKPWGEVKYFFSTATEGVATLTSHVSHGLSTVIETSIGVPDPALLAKQQKEEMEKARAERGKEESTSTPTQETAQSDERNSKILGQFVTGVTQISNKVISSGLDTLEGIGKKTMTILQEGDPGLVNKKKILGIDNEKPVLSQILREAKEENEKEEQQMALMKRAIKKMVHFESLFDNYTGLVHLEALEMLSKQSEYRLQSLMKPLSGKALRELQETLAEVQELCELPDSDNETADGSHTADELNEKLCTATEELGMECEFELLVACWRERSNWLEKRGPATLAQDVHDNALECLAQTAALAIAKLHKLAERLLILEHHNTVSEAEALGQLTTVLCWHMGGISTRYGTVLTELGSSESTNSLITSVFLEGSNSTSYIQNAFKLFVPILQMGAA